MNLLGAMILWVACLPVHLTVAIAKFPLAPVAVYGFSTEDKKHLETPFQWLETTDNDLGGDYGWQHEHIEPGSDPYSDWNRVGWLWRNGGHAVNYGLLGIDAEPVPDFSRGLNVRDDGFWLYRNGFPISDTKSLEVFWGWHIYGIVDGRNKYVFTTRIKQTDKLGF